MFYGNITALVGITFAVKIRGFMCLHIGEKYAFTRHGFSDKRTGLAQDDGRSACISIGLTSRAGFVIIAA